MSESGHVFNVERLRELIELMEEHNLREVDLREGEQQIQLKRGAEQLAAPMAPAAASGLFGWTDPIVPEGWHGALNLRAGTLVYIHP